MAYSSADLSAVEAAIIKLQTGTRTVQVTVGGKSVHYAETHLADLISLRTSIMFELGLIRPRAYAGQGGRCWGAPESRR